MLDLSGIPVWTKDRKIDDPFIIAGGTNAYNPEPVAEFFDLVFIGDAEEQIVELVRIIGEGRKAGKSREAILEAAAQLDEGVYVPGFYDVEYSPEGLVESITRNRQSVPQRVVAAKIPTLKAENYPIKPVVPLIDIAQERFALEVFRGCTQGCRFCHAGMVYRPVRERDPKELAEQAISTLEATGQENLAFLSLSTSDYTGLGETMSHLGDYLKAKKVSTSFPSMRLDSFTNEIATYAKQQKKSGLTFAPEAGTWRMRRVINKLISDDDLRNSVKIALEGGWKTLKFYFMLGLPTETEADLQGIVDLIEEVRQMSAPYGAVQINVTLSTFIPKPETPFQWERQDDKEVIRDKITYLMDRLRLKRVKASYRDPRYSEIEGLISRGDRRIAQVIHTAWQNGAIFDSWDDYFRYDLWVDAVKANGLDLDFYLRVRDLDEVLPWDHVDNRILKKFLKRERRNAYQEATVIDCRDGCLACGVCDFETLKMRIVKDETVEQEPNPAIAASDLLGKAAQRIHEPPTDYDLPDEVFTARLRYHKQGLSSYLGHLDVQRAFMRALSLANIPVVYTQGFNKRPRISAGPALPLGYTSETEFLDILLSKPPEDLKERLNQHLPEGIQVESTALVAGRLPALNTSLIGLTHRISFLDGVPGSDLGALIAQLLQQQNVYIKRARKRREIEVDIREYLDTIDIEDGYLRIQTQVKNGMGVRMNEILPVLFACSPENLPAYQVHREKAWLAPEEGPGREHV
jgi:radical SAM family uncharacterized protein/radical SAM-linked protein